MNFQLTDFGVTLFRSSATPPTLDLFKVGGAFNYLPAPTDTDIRGPLLFQGTPGLPVIVNANIVKYSSFMDNSVGDFQYGEIGLFYQNQMVALGSASALVTKIKNGVVAGNTSRIDAYLSEVGSNFDMNSDQAESNNAFQVSRIVSVDVLPMSGAATPNMYVIQGPDSTQSPVLAYTDRQALWALTDYNFGESSRATVVVASASSITVSLTDYPISMIPDYFGEVVIQFATGPIYSTCRYVKEATPVGVNMVLSFNTTLARLPNEGDIVWLYRRNILSTRVPQIPIATTSVLGGIIVGSGLAVTATGVLSVNLNAQVISVNGQQGVVTVNASNLPGLATVGKTNNYNDLDNKPDPYVLPIANTVRLGGVIAGSGVTINAAGVISVTPSIPIATTSRLGGIIVGSGLAVTATGVLSTSFPVATTSSLGVVKIGSGITVASDGTISAATGYTLPVATASVLGGVKQGSGVQIAGDGTLSVNQVVYTLPVATASVLGGVKQGSGVVIAADGAISVALPIASSLTLGAIKIGAGLAISADGTVSASSTYSLPTASDTILGGIRVGGGLSLNQSTGVLSVLPISVPLATTYSAGSIVVGDTLSVQVNGTLDIKPPNATTGTIGGVKAGTGVTIGTDGTINATAVPDNTKLNRVNGVAQGVFYTFGDQNAGTAAITVDVSLANVGRVNFVGTLNRTWSMVGWPVNGVYAEAQYEFVNAGTAPITFPSNIYFVCPDGTLSNDFATYIGLQRPGQTNFQASGIDFIIFWSHDAGATIYAKVM